MVSINTVTLGMLHDMRLEDPVNARLPVLPSKEDAKNLTLI